MFEDLGVDEQIARFYKVLWGVNDKFLRKCECFSHETTLKRRTIRRLIILTG